ncbi:unnamed protein product [Staurois parvus]|uniref:Uncharacterized protein n=1 Tax=Staurois parvus TaxID=386267 RepID=A0ABN9D750_9NEOB|nr:unnamed protein product [Staurois parvus]
MEASGDWQRGVEDTEWRAREDGGIEDTEWRPVEGLAERGGGHRVEASGGIGREGWRTLSGGQWRDW